MNPSQIHLALNHIPVLLSVTGALILIYGLFRKNETVTNTSLILLVVSAIATIPVYLTGEGTEEMVEETAGISEQLIGQHESMAAVSFALIGIAGFVAGLTLLWRKKVLISRKMAFATLVFSLIAFGALARTAHLGGRIRHTQLQSPGGVIENDGRQKDEAANNGQEDNGDKQDKEKDDD